MTLIEALMASGLLAMAAAGILLPLTAAAAAQTDAQRRVIATRLAADVIEQHVALGYEAIRPADSNPAITEQTVESFRYVLTKELISLDDDDPDAGELILLTVEVFGNARSITTLKTLIGSGQRE